MLGRAIELHIRVTGDLFDRFYDFDLDHWGLDTMHGGVVGAPTIAADRAIADVPR